ncbi:efflux RND transporter periplasmic adaptor subunit [Xanthomonas perforans]|uniref:Efflux RND transporter periplasmic adaptor subunit n=1 Tax=Xanthomonas perforans TaxID=442694 RepID=A0AAQ0YSK9_XANPE|nr:efflux transporter periplasmic adaptor subunit [Xanthomonas perforans 91-118]RXD36974.1 efflux RND transporter periplasmic adaptor subunit [Xanthomonas perforans]RXD40259.1 efflux RND transporter periplasmic adaptor subunit [Xanthomonas perforans]RXD44796.1 efflux RND transporter periplasmic adaptor subunit [Xanthomonas perforans]RXD47357.1 efflux RND transporter periplasmic adaptor subunit [Xanthomonas perforans]
MLVIVLAAAAWWFTRRPVVQVQTAPVVAISAGSSSASVLDASGYVVARRMATVSAQVTGKVREVMIEEGMRVEQGQVMATLDPLDADAQRSLSASQLSAARSQVDNMQAQLAVANADATRLQSLVGAQLVSRSQYDQAIAQRDALRAQLQNAQRNVQVASDQLAIAGIRSDFNVVRAPFAGVVTAKAAQPGEIVSPLSAGGGFTRTGIGTIVDMESLEIEVEVGESYIGRVQPKMPVEAVLNAYPEWKIPGEVIAIIPTADRGKATVKVRVALKVKDPRIVPEMGVRVSFLEQAKPQQAAKPQGVRVPAAALVERDTRTVAFVVGEHNTVSAHAVATGMVMGEDRQVLSGLAAGDSVVLNPPQTLKDGDKVTEAAPDAAE